MTRRDALRKAARVLAPLQPRRGLVSLGRHTSARTATRLMNALGAIEQGRWLAASGRRIPNLPDRFAVFEAAAARVVGERPLYLEFGVYRGRTLRWWASHLPGDGARLVGLDSFEGLPETWQPNAPQGSFSVGTPPEIEDPRVSFVVGRFEDSLPTFDSPPHDQLVANLDCDLYTSTRCALEWLTPHLRPGSLVYFDDLFNRDHQWRAAREWLDDPTTCAVPVAMARWGHHMLFQIGPE